MTNHPAKMAAPDLPTDATYDDVKHEFLVRSSGYGKGLRGEASSGENSAAQEAFRNFRKGWLAGREAAPAEPVAPNEPLVWAHPEYIKCLGMDGDDSMTVARMRTLSFTIPLYTHPAPDRLADAGKAITPEGKLPLHAGDGRHSGPITASCDNVLAWCLGLAHSEAAKEGAGDPIDRGLGLLAALRRHGLLVIQQSDVAAPSQPLPQLSLGEQRAILADPAGLMALMNWHDCQQMESDAMGAETTGNNKRHAELKAIGQRIVAEDPEIWSDEIRKEFAPSPLRTPEAK